MRHPILHASEDLQNRRQESGTWLVEASGATPHGGQALRHGAPTQIEGLQPTPPPPNAAMRNAIIPGRGIYFRICSFFFPIFFPASWLLGLAFRLLVGLCGFWWLLAFGFGFSHPLLSQFLSGLFGFCTLSLVLWIWLPASSASPVSLFESSLLRTSWGGLSPTPPPPATFRFLAEI